MTSPRPPFDTIPPSVVALTDYEQMACAHLTEQAWAYIAGGAGDELTIRRNREAFDAIELRTRVLADLTGGHTRVTLLGQSLEYPILLAPVAYQRLAHIDGERATAAAADVMQAGMILSTLSSVPVEEVAQETAAPLWFQLYVQPDRGATETLIRRAEAAGCQALVVTVDAPVSGVRNREQRAGFQLPPHVDAVHLREMSVPEATPRTLADVPVFGTSLLAAAPTWRDLEWIRATTSLPVLVKGITTPDDAERAIGMGMAGIVVSNHGGRTLDTLAPTIALLPSVAERVAGRVPILLDGGIRRGTDVLKALALGASAVAIGRPYVCALAVAGGLGVAHAIAMLRAELEMAMVLTGCARIEDISRDVLMKC